MDYATAHRFIVSQSLTTPQNPDTFLARLKQGKPPLPGQATSLLLALKVLFEGLQATNSLDRDLVHALYLLASESRHQFEAGRRSGIIWPPLLDEDLTRIAVAVKSIFAGIWQG
ncbi:MAG: Dethiobiotin synthetase [Cyanothece sp. SIO1E1]|nr:Dethiobiotin synthetase [Cyanothece sp. SIO1E1]